MEGNGPLNGTPRPLGKIVLADDPVAADATCARLMGFDPNGIVHVNEGARFLGNASLARIDQAGEAIKAPAGPFQVVPEFRYLYTKERLTDLSSSAKPTRLRLQPSHSGNSGTVSCRQQG